MDWKEFFKPTIGRLVAPILFLIGIIYYDLFSPIFGKASIFERLISAITNITHIIFVLVILLILYLLSCSISQFASKFKK